MPESEIIYQLINKDQRAFREFIEQNKAKTVNICFGFLHNRQDAEDIAQEVFIELYYSIKNFRKDSSLKTWLYRIAVNKSLDFIKMNKRKKRFGELLSIFGLSSKEEIFISDKSTPHSIIENNEN